MTEHGFGMVELVVAMTILTIVLLAFSLVFSNSLLAVGFQRERQTAQSLANQAMEQVRALPFSTVSRGLNSADSTLATDPNITIAGATHTLSFNGINETIPVGSGASTSAPLNPHETTVTSNGEDFIVRSYVTNYENSTTSNEYRITVVVSWTNHFNQGGLSTSVTSESVINASGGCIAASTHPFGSPCQPFLYSTASVGSGTITVSGTINGVSFDNAKLLLANADSSIQVEQISAIQGQAQTSGTSITDGAGSTTSAGAQSGSTGADNDPGSSSPSISNSSVTQPSVSATSLTDAAGRDQITVTPSASDTASNVSTPAASSTNVCQDLAGTGLTTNLPCGSARAQQASTASIAGRFYSADNLLGTSTLASVAAPANPVKLFTMRTATGGGSYCTATSGDGCADGRANRSIGTLSLGALPSTLSAPAGWGGYLVRLSNYADTVTAESGIGAETPSVAFGSTAPTISYWNGSGYTTLTLTTGSSAAIPASAVDRTWTVAGTAVRVQLIPSLTTGGTSTTDSAASSGTATRTSASATAASPISGSIHLIATSGTDTIADLTISIDLGSSTANTSYTAAPSAG